MSKKLRTHIKAYNLKRSKRAKKKVIEKNLKQSNPVRKRKAATGTFKIKVDGEMMEHPVGLSGYVPKGGVRQRVSL